LGRALEAVKDEFPRESYTLITKTGKYGGKVKDHIYDPELTKKGVERSLKRLHTDYLDVVCKSPALGPSATRKADG
jgi:D-arabinose 1-dehydrogenase